MLGKFAYIRPRVSDNFPVNDSTVRIKKEFTDCSICGKSDSDWPELMRTFKLIETHFRIGLPSAIKERQMHLQGNILSDG